MEDRETRKKHFSDSAHLLYRVFRYEKTATVKEAAYRLDIPEQTLQKWIMGEQACPPEVYGRLYTEFPDARATLHDGFCPPGHKIVLADADPEVVKPTAAEAVCESLLQLSKLHQTIEKEWSDGKLTPSERKHIRKHVLRAHASIDAVYQRARAGDPGKMPEAIPGEVGNVYAFGKQQKVTVGKQ